MATGEDVLMIEGFLCPICKADLGTSIELLAHFQEEHTDEQDLLKSFKDLFGKAKKKLLKQDGPEDFTPALTTRLSPTHYVEWKPQEIGAIVSHTSDFEKDRSARVSRFSMPTNLLLIRLDKLLTGMPTDPVKKKAHEQNVVPWLDGDSVTRCPSCARSFYLTRRKHHCRLCGSVLCHDCSAFLPLNAAKKVLNKPEEDNENEVVSSYLTLRICQHCLDLLETREQLRESQNSKPIIKQFYDRLFEYRTQADQHVEVFNKMAKSLNCGESTYNLGDAQVLRVKLLRLADNIEGLSNKIAILGTKDPDNPPQGQALRLQKSIRNATASYLRNTLLSLPVLPSEDQLKVLQLQRLEMQAKYFEEMKRENSVDDFRSTPNSVSKQNSVHSRSTPEKDNCSVGQGWVPEKKQNIYKSDNPLIEQMNIIRNYIQEARSANRHEEVTSLEANLQELKQEYWRCQQELEAVRYDSQATSGKKLSERQSPDLHC